MEWVHMDLHCLADVVGEDGTGLDEFGDQFRDVLAHGQLQRTGLVVVFDVDIDLRMRQEQIESGPPLTGHHGRVPAADQIVQSRSSDIVDQVDVGSEAQQDVH